MKQITVRRSKACSKCNEQIFAQEPAWKIKLGRGKSRTVCNDCYNRMAI